MFCFGLQACGNKLHALAGGVLWFVKISPEADQAAPSAKLGREVAVRLREMLDSASPISELGKPTGRGSVMLSA